MTKNDKIYNFVRPNLKGQPQTKTSLFMLASVGLDSRVVPFKLLSYFGFVNCYLSHKQGLDSPSDSIVMVFNPTREAMNRFHEFYEVYKDYPTFHMDYMVDFNLVVVVFKVKKWKKDLEMFRDSKYSKISKQYAEQLKFTDFKTGKTTFSDEYKIIHKDKDYKKKLEDKLSLFSKDYNSPVIIDDSQELMSPLDFQKETFDYEFNRSS